LGKEKRVKKPVQERAANKSPGDQGLGDGQVGRKQFGI